MMPAMTQEEFAEIEYAAVLSLREAYMDRLYTEHGDPLWKARFQSTWGEFAAAFQRRFRERVIMQVLLQAQPVAPSEPATVTPNP